MPRRRDERARVNGPYWIEATGYWRVTSVDPSQASAKDRKRDSYFREREAAEDYARMKREAYARRDGKTIGEAIEAFEKHLALSIAETSWKERGLRLRTFFRGVEGVNVGRLQQERAAELYAALQQGRSVDTHRNILGNAKGFYAWCVEQGWASSSPIAAVKGVGRRSTGKLQLTGDEARRFYATALRMAEQEDHGALGAAMLLSMGLRSSEVYKRRVRDLDLGGTVLRVHGAKTDKGNRLVAVPGVLQPLLLELAEARGPFDLLFANADGSPHTRAWLLAAVARVCRQAGVPRVCAHALRGTHSSLALEAVGVREVADSLGHVDPRTTLRHYAGAGSAEAGAQERTLRVLEGGKR